MTLCPAFGRYHSWNLRLMAGGLCTTPNFISGSPFAPKIRDWHYTPGKQFKKSDLGSWHRTSIIFFLPQPNNSMGMQKKPFSKDDSSHKIFKILHWSYKVIYLKLHCDYFLCNVISSNTIHFSQILRKYLFCYSNQLHGLCNPEDRYRIYNRRLLALVIFWNIGSLD